MEDAWHCYEAVNARALKAAVAELEAGCPALTIVASPKYQAFMEYVRHNTHAHAVELVTGLTRRWVAHQFMAAGLRVAVPRAPIVEWWSKVGEKQYQPEPKLPERVGRCEKRQALVEALCAKWPDGQCKRRDKGLEMHAETPLGPCTIRADFGGRSLFSLRSSLQLGTSPMIVHEIGFPACLGLGECQWSEWYPLEMDTIPDVADVMCRSSDYLL